MVHTHLEVGQVVTCTWTGKQFTVERDGSSFNCAQLHDGRVISDEGVEKMGLDHIRDHSKPFGAYLSEDGKHITGWKGNIRATVTQRSTSRTGWYGSRITHIQAVDQFGGLWYGKGAGSGMYITLRPMKGKAK